MVGDGYENQEVQEIQYHIVFYHTDFPTACQPYQGHAQTSLKEESFLHSLYSISAEIKALYLPPKSQNGKLKQ